MMDFKARQEYTHLSKKSHKVCSRNSRRRRKVLISKRSQAQANTWTTSISHQVMSQCRSVERESWGREENHMTGMNIVPSGQSSIMLQEAKLSQLWNNLKTKSNLELTLLMSWVVITTYNTKKGSIVRSEVIALVPRCVWMANKVVVNIETNLRVAYLETASQ